MRTVLLTGFEPFDGANVNPSALAVQALGSETMPTGSMPGVNLRTAILPVSYARAGSALRAALRAAKPDIVIAVGQAAGRADIGIERIAVNIDDAALADNDGEMRIDSQIVPDGPVAHLASIPVQAVITRMHEVSVPASVSLSAGSFLCNHVFYLLCHEAARLVDGPRVGLIHVPALPEQVLGRPGFPSMALATIIAGLRAAVRAASESDAGEHVAGSVGVSSNVPADSSPTHPAPMS